MHEREGSAALRDELDQLDRQISKLREVRAATTYRLEQAVREADRLRRHLSNQSKEESTWQM